MATELEKLSNMVVDYHADLELLEAEVQGLQQRRDIIVGMLVDFGFNVTKARKQVAKIDLTVTWPQSEPAEPELPLHHEERALGRVTTEGVKWSPSWTDGVIPSGTPPAYPTESPAVAESTERNASQAAAAGVTDKIGPDSAASAVAPAPTLPPAGQEPAAFDPVRDRPEFLDRRKA